MIGSLRLSSFYQRFLPEFQDALQTFISSGQYIGGRIVEDFEEKVRCLIGAEHAVGCKSGTSALQLSLLAAGIGKGDEVITVANTYYATAWSILSVGAKPIFCDVSPIDGLMDPDKLEGCITDRTRAVLPVHLYGYSAPLDDIRQVAAGHRLTVIEDCAHAFGSSYKGNRLGSDSDFACLSFYPTKNLGAFGDAGMVLTKSANAAKLMRSLRYFGDDERTSFIPHALHARLDPLQACLLSVELDHFDEIDRRRRHLAFSYHKAISDRVRCLPNVTERSVTPYVFPFFVIERAALLAFFQERDLQLQVHYATNLDQLPEFGRATPGRLPHTERHNSEVVSLPVHPSIGDEEVRFICDCLIEFLNKSGSHQ